MIADYISGPMGLIIAMLSLYTFLVFEFGMAIAEYKEYRKKIKADIKRSKKK